VMRKRMKLLSEAKEYTSRFEGKLSGGGSGPGQIALLKVKESLYCFTGVFSLSTSRSGRWEQLCEVLTLAARFGKLDSSALPTEPSLWHGHSQIKGYSVI